MGHGDVPQLRRARRTDHPRHDNPPQERTLTDQLTPDDVRELVEEYKQWSIGSNKAGNVLPKARFEDAPDRSYTLKGRIPRKFLQYEKQQFGINLGWTDDASPATGRHVARWFFTLQGNANRPIRYGDVIALANGKGDSFLRYADRDFGINLNWSKSPVFEWQLLGGPTGQPVARGPYLAIYNRKVKRFFVHFDRNVGGNIGWDDSQRWEDDLLDQAWQQVKQLVAEYGDEAVRAAVVAALAA